MIQSYYVYPRFVTVGLGSRWQLVVERSHGHGMNIFT